MKNYKTIQEVRDCKELSEIEKVQIEYYAEEYCLKEALENYAHVDVLEDKAINYATEIFNETYSIQCMQENIMNTDYEIFCKYLLDTGDIYQFNYKYLITNANTI